MQCNETYTQNTGQQSILNNGAVNTVHTALWPHYHYPNRNVFSDRRNSVYDKLCQHLSGATEDCSIVRGRQLRTLCRQRCFMSASLRMFGSLWNAVAAHEHRWQDGSRRPGTVVKCQKATGVRVWPPWSRRAGVPVASVADGAPAICGRSVGCQ